MKKEFHNLSYKLHEDGFKKHTNEKKALAESWFNEDTIDYWRHERMYQPIKPLLNAYPNSKWVTVGDGRFGMDSIRLKKMVNSIDVLPTDISPYLLEQAAERTLINKYKIENAEKLSFQDNEFDFSFCKEAYHHFPRPYMALYEMLRVSQRGIILIEPADKFPKKYPRLLIDKSKELIKTFLGKKIEHHDRWFFEDSGNYSYTITQREIEKIAIALQLPTIAFYNFNDYYEKGLEFQSRYDSPELFSKVKDKILERDRKCKLGLLNYQMLVAIVFKEKPETQLKADLKNGEFSVIDLPSNPFL